MTIWEWLTAIRRRWPVLLIGLLCTMCVVWAVHKRPVSYLACGSVIVGAPTTPTSPNVYNNTQKSLIAATGLITIELQLPTVQERLQADGATATYQAQMHNTGTSETPGYGEPEMDVCATSPDPGMSMHTTNVVLAEFGALLRAREVAAHVPPGSFLTSSVLASPGPVPEAGRPSQAYLAVVILGLILTVSCALWIDKYLSRLALKRKGASAAYSLAAARTSHARGIR